MLPTVSLLWLLTASFSVATETVVGVAGRRVTLPCSTAGGGVTSVCWGRAKASLFGCRNTVLETDGGRVTHSASYRYQLLQRQTGDVSLSIFYSRQTDSGFYHCRVQLPGLFNDQTHTVHLIVRRAPEPADVTGLPEQDSESSEAADPTEPNPSYTGTETTQETGRGEVWDHPEGPVVAPVKTSTNTDVQLSGPQLFVANTLRLSFIIFIPALLLTIGYRILRSQKRMEPQLASDHEEHSL